MGFFVDWFLKVSVYFDDWTADVLVWRFISIFSCCWKKGHLQNLLLCRFSLETFVSPHPSDLIRRFCRTPLWNLCTQSVSPKPGNTFSDVVSASSICVHLLVCNVVQSFLFSFFFFWFIPTESKTTWTEWSLCPIRNFIFNSELYFKRNIKPLEREELASH